MLDINLFKVIMKYPLIFSIVFGIYAFLIIVGILFRKHFPKWLNSFISIAQKQKIEQTENKFGKYREDVKNGNILTIIKCSLIVFSLNSLLVIQNIILSALLLPLILQLGYVAIAQGKAFRETKGSTFLSVFWFYVIGGLEWITYPLAISAGVFLTTGMVSTYILHQPLSVIGLLNDVMSIFIFCISILFVQSFLELIYIRKVLKHGGTGIPLKPY